MVRTIGKDEPIRHRVLSRTGPLNEVHRFITAKLTSPRKGRLVIYDDWGYQDVEAKGYAATTGEVLEIILSTSWTS